MASSEPAIMTVAGVLKRYEKYVVVDRVDLEVRNGEIYGLIGPEGSGKGSFMKAIASCSRRER